MNWEPGKLRNPTNNNNFTTKHAGNLGRRVLAALCVAFFACGSVAMANLDKKDGTLPNGGYGLAIGDGSQVDNYVGQLAGSIAIGKNAKVQNMVGTQEYNFAFGQTTFTNIGKWYSPIWQPDHLDKVAGGIAIGENTVARTGSIMLGTHQYDGQIGDITVESGKTAENSGVNVFETTLGTNSYNKGAFATVTGAYSAITGTYNGGSWSPATQNFGAVITGSLNSIESATSSSRYSSYSGIANSIVGVANRTNNSNGSLIFGAGNTITNSITSISAPSSSGNSAKELQEKLADVVKKSNGGGAVLAIGGGNTADWAQSSQLIGVNNTLNGKSDKVSQYVMLNGYNNTSENVKGVVVVGTDNNVTDTNGALVVGNKRTLTGANGGIFIGTMDQETETTVKDATALGHNANVTADGGVALGSGSISSIASGVAGWNPNAPKKAEEKSADKADSDSAATVDPIWTSTLGAVSVGAANEKGSTATRQITNVAAGSALTDAVNVAQLQSVWNTPISIYTGGKKDGDNYIPKDGGLVASPAMHDLRFDFGDGLKAEEVKNGTAESRILVTLDKNALKNDPDFKGEKGDTGATGAKGEKGDKGDPGSNTPVPGSVKIKAGDGIIIHNDGNGTYTVSTNIEGADTRTGSMKVEARDEAAEPQESKAPVRRMMALAAFDEENAAVVPSAEPSDDKGKKLYISHDTQPIDVYDDSGEKRGMISPRDKLSLRGDGNIVTTARMETGEDGTPGTRVDFKLEKVAFDGTTYVDKNGVSGGGKKITNVAAGTEDTDAVNVFQLKAVDTKVNNNSIAINGLNGRISDLGNRINRVGAGAAALAALHPQDFDPDNKWDFAAGYGNYRDANAVAVGAFYRPNDDLLFSVGGSFGGGENMMNAGISVKLGQGSDVPTGRAAMAAEIRDLRQDNASLRQEVEELKQLVEEKLGIRVK